nr:unnamed protein product [Digitaria exilis]
MSTHVFLHQPSNRYHHWPTSQNRERKRGAAFIDLPCFGNTTAVCLDVGYLGVAVVPLAGVFARLVKLRLAHVHFRRPCALGDAVSSRRCPSLEKLTVRQGRTQD